LKVLLFDGIGMILATKWLEEGRFTWPSIRSGTMRLTATQFAMLFDGSDRVVQDRGTVSGTTSDDRLKCLVLLVI
jgi:transposase